MTPEKPAQSSAEENEEKYNPRANRQGNSRRGSRRNSLTSVVNTEQSTYGSHKKLSKGKASAERPAARSKQSGTKMNSVEKKANKNHKRRRSNSDKLELKMEDSANAADIPRIGGSGVRDKTPPEVALLLNYVFWSCSVSPSTAQLQRLANILQAAKERECVSLGANMFVCDVCLRWKAGGRRTTLQYGPACALL